MTSENAFTSRANRRSGIYIVFLLCLLTYFNTFGNGFINYDDPGKRILTNPFIDVAWQWSYIKTAFMQATADYYDPVYVLSYVIDYQLFGMNPAGFHLMNLLYHTANSILVWLVLLRVTGKPSLALLAAALFAVHPIHVESVSWATSRKDVLSQFFALSSFWVYLKGIHSDNRRYLAVCAGSIVLFLLGMMVKPTIAVLPLMVLLTELLLLEKPVPWKRTLCYQAACYISLAIFLVATIPLTLGQAVRPYIQFSPEDHFVLFTALYGYFVKQILLPLNLNAYYFFVRDEIIPLWLAIGIAFCLAGLIFWIVRGILRSLESRARGGASALMIWGVAVYLIGLFPFTNVLPRTIYFADRYEYFSSIGFCLVLALLLSRIPWKSLKVFSLAACLVLYAALSMDRIPVWKNSVSLWQDVNKKRSVSDHNVYRTMGNAYAFEHQWTLAARNYEKAGLREFTSPKMQMMLARAYFFAGEIKTGATILHKIHRTHPDYFPETYNSILRSIQTGDYDEAEKLLRSRSEKIGEEDYEIFNRLIQTGRAGKAKISFKRS